MRLRYRFIMILLGLAAACGGSTPTQPSSTSLVGSWIGSMAGRTPCAGDWTSVELTLGSSGTGELVTRDGRSFTAALVIDARTTEIDVMVPPGTAECGTVPLVVSSVTAGANGASSFAGHVIGRCCGTLQAQFEFIRR